MRLLTAVEIHDRAQPKPCCFCCFLQRSWTALPSWLPAAHVPTAWWLACLPALARLPVCKTLVGADTVLLPHPVWAAQACCMCGACLHWPGSISPLHVLLCPRRMLNASLLLP